MLPNQRSASHAQDNESEREREREWVGESAAMLGDFFLESPIRRAQFEVHQGKLRREGWEAAPALTWSSVLFPVRQAAAGARVGFRPNRVGY